jgi:transcriptional regulator with XRE-family HTH domain
MKVNPTALSIRAKKLGLLLRDARLASGKTIAECAQAIGVTEEQFEAYELGEKSPSLPELEALALSLNISLSHFWGNEILSRHSIKVSKQDFNQAIRLRQRIIGALVRKARIEAGITLEELAEKAWSSPTLLENYELGEAPIPFPDLEVLSGLLNRPMNEFQDHRGPLGRGSVQQRSAQDIEALPQDLREFISKPVNRPYLELAKRLSEMSVEKLRAVAEGLLEITL